MLQTALKEWAVVCKALAKGQQALIVRKGGLIEATGEFTVEAKRFWLYPTYTHQQRVGIQPMYVDLLEESEADRPPEGIVRLQHFAEVTAAYHLRNEMLAQMLAHLHIWSDETIHQRFRYRTPGLIIMAVRVFECPAQDVEDLVEYRGCRSWITLKEPLSTDGASPVLPDAEMKNLHDSLDALLRPSAYA